MLVAAALVPGTALLVPGAAGRAEVLVDLRAQALDAVAELVAAGPDLVVVIAPGSRDRQLDGPVRATLAPAGILDGRLGWSRPAADGAAVVGIAASVGLLLLARSGWLAPVRVVEVGPSPGGSTSAERAVRLHAVGADLVAAQAGTGVGGQSGPDRFGLLVVGSLSARHGPDAPLADDARAPAFDARVLADLADGGPAARARLADLDADLASELAVTGWGAWQLLVGAVGDREVEAVVLGAAAPFGAQHVVATWVVRPDCTPDRTPDRR